MAVFDPIPVSELSSIEDLKKPEIREKLGGRKPATVGVRCSIRFCIPQPTDSREAIGTPTVPLVTISTSSSV